MLLNGGAAGDVPAKQGEMSEVGAASRWGQDAVRSIFAQAIREGPGWDGAARDHEIGPKNMQVRKTCVEGIANLWITQVDDAGMGDLNRVDLPRGVSVFDIDPQGNAATFGRFRQV